MKEGWGKPYRSQKWHYFKGAISICGKWMFHSEDLEQGNDNSKDNCAECKKKINKSKSA